MDTLSKIATALNVHMSELLEIENDDDFANSLFASDDNFFERINLAIDDLTHQIDYYEKIDNDEKAKELKGYRSFLAEQKERIKAYADLIIKHGSVASAFLELAKREIFFYLSKLNQSGIEEATKRVGELTRLVEYKKSSTEDIPLSIDALLKENPLQAGDNPISKTQDPPEL